MFTILMHNLTCAGFKIISFKTITLAFLHRPNMVQELKFSLVGVILLIQYACMRFDRFGYR